MTKSEMLQNKCLEDSPSLRELYLQTDFPVFQNRMYETVEEAIDCPKGDIRIVEDSETGLIYNELFRPELMVYDAHYQNEQACSPIFQSHLNAVAETIERNIGRNDLIEVGCGKGYFLELLLNKGFNVTGFDPTYEGNNSRVQRRYFASGVMKPANGLILRHVLEHIQNPLGFLEQLRVANGGQGRIYIEVPCFDWICQRRAWFDIFYEHVNYFRLSDFGRMFDVVIDSGKCFGGQYLYVIAELSSLREPVINLEDRVDFPADFFTQLAITWNGQTAEPAYIWGGASKGVIYSLLRQRAGLPVKTVIDVNPAKQGKFLPATGIKVLSPEDALMSIPHNSLIYVMNSNYLAEIKAMTNNKYDYLCVDGK